MKIKESVLIMVVLVVTIVGLSMAHDTGYIMGFSDGITTNIVANPTTQDTKQQQEPPPASQSSIDPNALAEHLTSIDAVMFGAYWCPFCKRQIEEVFGLDAFLKIQYVECDAMGENPQVELCQQEEIGGYPTWKINGKKYPGLKSLEELAQISGFPQ